MRKTPALLVCALLGAALFFVIHRWCPQYKHGLRRVADVSRAERWGADEFAALVRASVPGLEVVRKAPAHEVGNLYLTRCRLTWEVAQGRLLRQEEFLSRWRGTVLLDTVSSGMHLSPDQWGDDVFLLVDRFLLFGDPVLVREIRDALSR